jgi:hypothetical protein
MSLAWIVDALQAAATSMDRVAVHVTWLASAAAVLVPLLWHVFAGHAWRLRVRVPVAMAAESLVLALPLVGMAFIVFGVPELSATSGSSRQWLIAIEAGIFEELLFRFVGFAVIDFLLTHILGRRNGWTLGLTLLTTSLLFAGHHHLPATGEAFDATVFGFRTLAGLWLGIVFLTRGFGLAVGCHVAYNLAAIWLSS